MRVFASHGCAFRGPRMRFSGEKCGQTCTVGSFYFRRTSTPCAVDFLSVRQGHRPDLCKGKRSRDLKTRVQIERKSRV